MRSGRRDCSLCTWGSINEGCFANKLVRESMYHALPAHERVEEERIGRWEGQVTPILAMRNAYAPYLLGSHSCST